MFAFVVCEAFIFTITYLAGVQHGYKPIQQNSYATGLETGP
jgi:hypothetical protein